jgi:hypothetical protein
VSTAAGLLDGADRIRYVHGVRPEDIRAYKKRWELVAAHEREELGRMTPTQKFADLAMLMGVARALGGSTHTDEEVEQVRMRWNLLVERLCG